MADTIYRTGISHGGGLRLGRSTCSTRHRQGRCSRHRKKHCGNNTALQRLQSRRPRSDGTGRDHTRPCPRFQSRHDRIKRTDYPVAPRDADVCRTDGERGAAHPPLCRRRGHICHPHRRAHRPRLQRTGVPHRRCRAAPRSGPPMAQSCHTARSHTHTATHSGTVTSSPRRPLLTPARIRTGQCPAADTSHRRLSTITAAHRDRDIAFPHPRCTPLHQLASISHSMGIGCLFGCDIRDRRVRPLPRPMARGSAPRKTRERSGSHAAHQGGQPSA